jgi:SAM-dependent methyltransferase
MDTSAPNSRWLDVRYDNAERVFYENYDSVIRLICPDYDEMFEALVEAIPLFARSVVDLGCGTGSLISRLVASRTSLERVVGIDMSSDLLLQSRMKLEGESNVSFVQGDLRNMILPRADVYVSSSGVFLQFEAVAGEDADEEEERWSYLRWWMSGKGVPASVQEIAVNHISEHDRPMTLSQHKHLAEAAGLHFSVIKGAPGFAVFSATQNSSFQRMD